MGFYLRKSISVGPLRFNLSKSGIGISAGVIGLRFGIGPRGNYVHIGRGGLHYRATLPTSSSLRDSPAQFRFQSTAEIPLGTHAPLEEIESADISTIVDSSSRELLDELNRKSTKVRLCPFVAVSSVVLLAFGAFSGWSAWLVGLLAIAFAAGTYAAHIRDTLQKTVVMFYDFDADMEAAYAKLHTAASQLSNCGAAWHIEASGKVHDRKYHAGASDLVRRNSTSIRRGEPPYVKTNIETVAVSVGRQTLHFFPDRVFIYDQNGVGAVGYQELRVEVGVTQFIESESVPGDAEIVGRTWKYVNKSGGPDKRFKDNTELPICRYEEIALSSQSGLNEVIQLSRCGAGRGFAEAISSLGRKMPKEVVCVA
ncbi:hypothetical protein A8C75_20455 [Marinobacterium aestuarii]|uniref:DUF4236 domain-containing protein n=1 Tax=Marinobacterium aestuarii TaxID=1821621 RepID=A0A1A9F3R1_9GAMM|nr:DUF4236 domain-containing protein [Marinobacterium aestuarii]ANG64610.1 hypothetical protein A8C75_20455 [Marinobacterium aestuarii]